MQSSADLVDLTGKLAIPADGADLRDGKDIGGMSICHSCAPDGRSVSLLKVLLATACLYDCCYCIKRRSGNVQQVCFTPEEVARLTFDFCKRNCVEGIFLSMDWSILAPDRPGMPALDKARLRTLR